MLSRVFNHYLPNSMEVVMKKHLFSKMVVIGAVVVLMGFGVNAFAGMGGAGANLTDDQIKQMESERNAFQTTTKDIREQLNEKGWHSILNLQNKHRMPRQPQAFKRESLICRLNLTRSDWLTFLK
jgi:hypothetical protein